jgi:hypothetical protein
MAKPGDWMENVQNLADGDHVAIGAAAAVVPALFAHTAQPMLVASCFLLPAVLVKAYWYDLRYESGETWKSSTVDAIGYLIGQAVGWGLLYLAWRHGSWGLR